MFFGCHSLTELDLKSFDTTNVTDMRYMFCACSSLTKLEFGQNFNTSKVTKMGNMFYKCSKLENLEFRDNFNTENVTDMEKYEEYVL